MKEKEASEIMEYKIDTYYHSSRLSWKRSVFSRSSTYYQLWFQYSNTHKYRVGEVLKKTKDNGKVEFWGGSGIKKSLAAAKKDLVDEGRRIVKGIILTFLEETEKYTITLTAGKEQ